MSTSFRPIRSTIHRLVVLPIIGLAGCGPGKPPLETLSTADTALNQAMSAEAAQFAPLDLQRAIDKLNQAKEAISDEEYSEARRLAEEAKVDAQVAEARARAASAQRMEQESRQTVRSLRSSEGTQRPAPAPEGDSNVVP